jgi:hypothetical protein
MKPGVHLQNTVTAISNRKPPEQPQHKIAELALALEDLPAPSVARQARMKREESPTAYAIMSKGFVAQIEQMRREIDEYLGITREGWKNPKL